MTAITIPPPPEPRVKGIHDIPVKEKRKKVTYNIKEILRRNYEELEFNEYYTALMGRPEPKFVAMLYGFSGCGKSVYAIQFANYFAKNFGKVFYNSHEERIKKTLRDRIRDYGIDAHQRFQVGDAVPFNQMMDMNRKNHYRLIVIDSIQYMEFGIEEHQEIQKEFKKRSLSMLYLSHGNTLNNPHNAVPLLYASDIKAFFQIKGKYGVAQFQSRYKKTIVTTDLFKIKEEKVINPDVIIENEESNETFNS